MSNFIWGETQDAGIYLTAADNTTIRLNTISNNQNYGIQFINATNSLVELNNLLMNNTNVVYGGISNTLYSNYFDALPHLHFIKLFGLDIRKLRLPR